MTNIRDSLQELDAAAAELREQTDALRAALADIDSHLGRTGLRLTAWLDAPFRDDDGAEWRMGYARLGPDWHVVVRRADVEPPPPAVSLLHAASRAARIAAAEHLPALLTELTSAATAMLDDTRAARASASQSLQSLVAAPASAPARGTRR